MPVSPDSWNMNKGSSSSPLFFRCDFFYYYCELQSEIATTIPLWVSRVQIYGLMLQMCRATTSPDKWNRERKNRIAHLTNYTLIYKLDQRNPMDLFFPSHEIIAETSETRKAEHTRNWFGFQRFEWLNAIIKMTIRFIFFFFSFRVQCECVCCVFGCSWSSLYANLVCVSSQCRRRRRRHRPVACTIEVRLNWSYFVFCYYLCFFFSPSLISTVDELYFSIQQSICSSSILLIFKIVEHFIFGFFFWRWWCWRVSGIFPMRLLCFSVRHLSEFLFRYGFHRLWQCASNQLQEHPKSFCPFESRWHRQKQIGSRHSGSIRIFFHNKNIIFQWVRVTRLNSPANVWRRRHKTISSIRTKNTNRIEKAHKWQNDVEWRKRKYPINRYQFEVICGELRTDEK